MAETTGLVQKLFIAEAFACVWIGPTPNNTSLLIVLNDGSVAGAAFAGAAMETLAAASTNYRSVAAIHGNNDSSITALRIDPV
jgi:hypothetical protein